MNSHQEVVSQEKPMAVCQRRCPGLLAMGGQMDSGTLNAPSTTLVGGRDLDGK